jgi:hypothetical protein
MKKSINDIGNKRGRGRPAIDATPVLVRMPPAALSDLDAWIARHTEAISRPVAIRRLVEMGLAGATTGRAKKSPASSKVIGARRQTTR